MRFWQLIFMPVLLLGTGAPDWHVDVFTASDSGAATWTITLSAPYCDGYAVDDGVFIRPEPPLVLPESVSASDVLLADGPANVSVADGVLRVLPAQGGAQSTECSRGDRDFTIKLLPEVGLRTPDFGDYAIDVWIGSGATPTPVRVSVMPPMSRLAILDGHVVLGPTCPVIRQDDPSACERPYQATLLIQSLDRPSERPVEVRSDASGFFSVQLEGGRYEIRPEAPSNRMLPRGATQEVATDPGAQQTVIVHYDTGIR